MNSVSDCSKLYERPAVLSSVRRSQGCNMQPAHCRARQGHAGAVGLAGHAAQQPARTLAAVQTARATHLEALHVLLEQLNHGLHARRVDACLQHPRGDQRLHKAASAACRSLRPTRFPRPAPDPCLTCNVPSTPCSSMSLAAATALTMAGSAAATCAQTCAHPHISRQSALNPPSPQHPPRAAARASRPHSPATSRCLCS